MEGGGVILGVGRSEAPGGDGLEQPQPHPQSQLQIQADSAVALNRSAEAESVDGMDIDDAPGQGPNQPARTTQSPGTVTDAIVQVQKQLKRKRASNGPVLAAAEKDGLVAGCRQELEGLFEYYKEVSGHRMTLEGGNSSSNAMTGRLIEESNLGLSKLVDETYAKLKGTDGISMASVRSSVLLIGQRMMYGKSSSDADVLEDESELPLWCWEVRDLKLMPVKTRAFFSARRTARKKIHERITAIYSTLSVLGPPGVEAEANELRKVSLQLNKALNLEGIKLMMERLTQKNITQRGPKVVESTGTQSIQDVGDQNAGGIEITNTSELQNGNVLTNEKVIQRMQKQLKREIKRKEKEEHQMMKQQKKAQKEARKEQKRSEKEEVEAKKRQKRQEEEALKEQKRREKEEAEMRKQQKRQHEEAEKEQKRLEKEVAHLKKQLVIQKQASLMERFLKNKQSEKLEKSVENDTDAHSTYPCTPNKEMVSAATSLIDSSFSKKESWSSEDLRRLQIIGWHKLSSYNRTSTWGMRSKPKKKAFKELKLQKSSDDMLDEILSTPNEDTFHNSSHETDPEKLGNDVDAPMGEAQFCATNKANSLSTRFTKRKLLQFAKSNRPAYYGTWRKKSAVVGPKCPLKMDPDLDYEIDSDDEWEEEDPGESLSDCEKDNDEVMEEDTKITDEESEDSFVVPDGYLSDNEGIKIEGALDDNEDDVSSMPPKQCPEVEEFRTLLRQQKVLNTLTDQALRKSQPLVIANITHEKDKLLTAEDLKGTPKLEQLCLQVLSMRICPGGVIIDVPVIGNSSAEEIYQSTVKNSPAVASAIPDTDLPEIVRVIQTSRDGINKLVELLHQMFPNVPKIQLSRKVREISDFLDNRWQVKLEVLDKLGFNSSPGTTIKSSSSSSSSPANHPKKMKGIAMYFSKRCLPPEEAINALASSPELRLKSKTVQDGNGAPQVDPLPSLQ